MLQKLQKSNIQTFKWTGSKWLIIDDLLPHIPDKGNVYYEPFLGGGTVLLHTIPYFRKTICGDIYAPLINLWKSLRDSPNEFDRKYSKLWLKLRDEVKNIDPLIDKGKKYPKVFYKCRDEFNKSKDPFHLLFLSKTCMNGVIRFSQEGKFNNSFHHGRLGQRPESFSKCIHNQSRLIRNTKFYTKDAADLLCDVKKNDFVFLDPPYFNSNNRYIQNYSIEKLEDLLEFLNSKSAKWICTYDSRNNIKINCKLYKKRIKSMKYGSRIKRLGGKGLSDTQELIYLNY
jgi:DNA adenine methylase